MAFEESSRQIFTTFLFLQFDRQIPVLNDFFSVNISINLKFCNHLNIPTFILRRHPEIYINDFPEIVSFFI